MAPRSFLLIVVLLLSAIPAAWSETSEQAKAEHADRVFASLADAHSPGFAVLVRKNGHTLFEHGYGVRDLRTASANDATTNFRLASCTKQFTAMAVMLLVHDKKLRYDEPLTEIFPKFSAYGGEITIRSLLTHTSGLPDYAELMDAAVASGHARWSETRQIQDKEVLQLLEAAKRGKFVPGTRWSYGTSGYVMLGLVVAKVSGMTFPEFLHQRIFAPLGMNHTVAYVRGTNEVPDRAYGHSKEGPRFHESDQSSTSATLGDGAVYSNLVDLAKWDDALRDHTLLSAGEMQATWTPVVVAGKSHLNWSGDPGDSDPLRGVPVSYGFGWFLDPYRGHSRTWHYGDTSGFKSYIERFADGLTIVVLANRTDVDPGALAAKIQDIYLAGK